MAGPHRKPSASIGIAGGFPAAAFGPKAWFDMERPRTEVSKGKVGERKVIVRDASYGGREKVAVAFVFTRPHEKSCPARWQIAYETDLWLASSGAIAPIASTPPVRFEDFLKGKKLVETVAATRVGRTIEGIFASRLSLSAPPPPRFVVGLDEALNWHVSADNRRGLASFDNQVIIPALAFGWSREAEGKDLFFIGSAELAWGAAGRRETTHRRPDGPSRRHRAPRGRAQGSAGAARGESRRTLPSIPRVHRQPSGSTSAKATSRSRTKIRRSAGRSVPLI